MRGLLVSTALLCCAAPAGAFSATPLAGGGYEYFFAAPSLRIESAGDLDLTGVSFTEGVTGGFCVGASFALDWQGAENAWQTTSRAAWRGRDVLPRGQIVAGERRMPGVNIASSAGSMLSVGSAGDGGGGLSVGGAEVRIVDGGSVVSQSGGGLSLEPSMITLLTPVPEPAEWSLLVAGLLALVGVSARRGVRA
jgi:hypothetical protein